MNCTHTIYKKTFDLNRLAYCVNVENILMYCGEIWGNDSDIHLVKLQKCIPTLSI